MGHGSAVSRAARLLAWVAGLLPVAPRTCGALWLDSAWRVAEVGGEGVRDPSPSRVSPAFPICYIHVGKCAGGTLNHTMQKIRSLSDNDWSIIIIHTFNGPVANPKVEQGCLHRNIVLWVRDPMERLLASWRFEIEEYNGQRIKYFAERNPDLFAGVPPSKLFDLNYVAGVIQEHVADGRRSQAAMDADFLQSFHHGDRGLSWYLGEKAVELDGVPNDMIFVGRAEHIAEDWERLLAKLQVPLRSDTSLVAEAHGTRKKDTPLSSDAASLLRRVAQPEYRAMEKLVSRGLLSADYLDSIAHRKEFTMRLPRPS